MGRPALAAVCQALAQRKNRLSALQRLELKGVSCTDEDVERMLIARYPGLTVLDLSNNDLTSVPTAVRDLGRLQHLDLANNPRLRQGIRHIIANSCPDLAHVDVSGAPALRSPPIEVVRRGPAATAAVLKEMRAGIEEWRAARCGSHSRSGGT